MLHHAKGLSIFSALQLPLAKMDEEGMIRWLHKKWLRKQDSKSNPDVFLTLGYNNLVFPFLALIFGCSASLMIAICERIMKNNTIDIIGTDQVIHLDDNNSEIDQKRVH